MNTPLSAYRYAVYLAPTGAWRDLGRRWLGRCEETGTVLSRMVEADPRIDSWTRTPRRYGLHATLKPPFRLREDQTPAALDSAVRALARRQAPFGLPLQLQALRGFLAWCCADARGRCRVNALAQTVVAELDDFRAPADANELTRRDRLTLNPQQRQMLERWGYPYVFDTFTFHITLTDPLDDRSMHSAQTQLAALGGSTLHTPMRVNAISVYVEPEPGADFIVARHYGFDGSISDGAGARFMEDV
ncbi:DUF1045 domain-containing protein [Bordetella sp. 15P40C-2]|uniref:DUF1045 domain-containing protein n=1 Tax=Bordetella sp. 15P40C-2 TaxID=2572246 RepID=UPI001321FD0C|nr:DUF1045 domain-containing protein [Bordetella sp. 15P40C-2]MVW70817.1 DUF1045 domain-containing protein [Bordetella sp. 15P40C-2]